MEPKHLRLGTRGSLLARVQSQFVARTLMAKFPELLIEEVIIQTSGDRIQDRPLKDIGGKALFTKEIQSALQEQQVDFAVHSLKDVEHLGEGNVFAAILERETPWDILITRDEKPLDQVLSEATIGTCSPRRCLQLNHFRPDLKQAPMRGNVDTRLKKLAHGEVDGIILAVAALNRLGLPLVGDILTQFVPACGQGALAIEAPEHAPYLPYLQALNHPETSLCVQLERQVLQHIQGNCFTPIGVHAKLQDEILHMSGIYASDITLPPVQAQVSGPQTNGPQLALELASLLKP